MVLNVRTVKVIHKKSFITDMWDRFRLKNIIMNAFPVADGQVYRIYINSEDKIKSYTLMNIAFSLV